MCAPGTRHWVPPPSPSKPATNALPDLASPTLVRVRPTHDYITIPVGRHPSFLESHRMLKDVLIFPHYAGIFQKHLGKKIYLIFIITFLSGISEGFGIILLLPMLAAIGGEPGSVRASTPQDNPSSGVQHYLEALFGYFSIELTVSSVLSFMFAFFLLKGTLNFLGLSACARYKSELLTSFKTRLFETYSGLLDGGRTIPAAGQLNNTFNEQVARALLAFDYFNYVSLKAVQALLYFGLGILVSWQFGILALTAAVVIYVIFSSLNKIVHRLSRTLVEESSRLDKLIVEFFQALKYLSAVRRTSAVQPAVVRSIGKLADIQRRFGKANAFTQSFQEPVAVGFIALAIGIQLWIFDADIAAIMVSIVLFYRGVSGAWSVEAYWQALMQYGGSVEQIDNELGRHSFKERYSPAAKPLPLAEAVRLESVTFAYPNQERATIDGVSLTIASNRVTAFVGASGGGKTTLVDLIVGLNRPSAGKVIFNASHFKTADIRKSIGYVPQDSCLFDDTIANNITLWNTDGLPDEAQQRRIRYALECADLKSFVDGLELGVDTRIGDRGSSLSGGQRQRLCIARELYREPPLLVLDEATSALDAETEKVFVEAIDQLKGSVTVLLVAHRMASVAKADYVYVIDGGRVIEQGTFKELSTADSVLSKLIRLQKI